MFLHKIKSDLSTFYKPGKLLRLYYWPQHLFFLKLLPCAHFANQSAAASTNSNSLSFGIRELDGGALFKTLSYLCYTHRRHWKIVSLCQCVIFFQQTVLSNATICLVKRQDVSWQGTFPKWHLQKKMNLGFASQTGTCLMDFRYPICDAVKDLCMDSCLDLQLCFPRKSHGTSQRRTLELRYEILKDCFSLKE